nr:YnjH family protein [Edwardsiella piscicida]
MKQAVMMALAALLWSGALQAQGSVSTDGAQQGAAAVAAGGIDVVVPMPANGYTNGVNGVNCSRRCLYQDRYYSEGAVVSTDGLLLQCQANPQVLSTNNLRWVVLKKG